MTNLSSHVASTAVAPDLSPDRARAFKSLASRLKKDHPVALSSSSKADSYLQKLCGGLRNEEGFTLAEMMVVCVVMAVLLAISAGVFASQINAEIRMTQAAEQDTSLQLVNGYLAQNLADVDEGSVGLPGSGGNVIDPITLSNDQFVFTEGDHCYRVFYLGYTKEIKVALSNDVEDECADIRPVRGPNEEVAPDEYLIVDPKDPLYDWVLDYPSNGAPSADAKVFSLVNRVAVDEDGDSMSTGPFLFINSLQEELLTDYHASSSSENPYYAEPGMSDVAAVKMTIFLLGSDNPESTIGAKPRDAERTYYVDQTPAS